MIQLYNTALAQSTNFPYSSVSPSRTQPGPPRHVVFVHGVRCLLSHECQYLFTVLLCNLFYALTKQPGIVSHYVLDATYEAVQDLCSPLERASVQALSFR
jgi:hypothetical protein